MEEMTIQHAGRQKNLLVWSQRVAECRSSGLSVNRWCAEHGIRPKTSYNWQKKVFAAMIEQQKMLGEVTETQSRFAELPVPVPKPAPTPMAEPIQKNSLVASIRVGNALLGRIRHELHAQSQNPWNRDKEPTGIGRDMLPL